jgi:Bacterial mobilisation protein (MobC)
MARPKISEPRAYQLNLRFTARELESINRRASALGMRPVQFGRTVLLGTKDRPVADQEPAHNHARLIRSELSRLGNNLNQLVRHLHQTGDPLPPDLEPLLIDIRRLIARGAGK